MTVRSAHERTLAIIEDFYDAALDETLWPAALRKAIADFFHKDDEAQRANELNNASKNARSPKL